VAERNEIAEMIPLLVQGRLDQQAADELRQEIENSPQLRKEFQFWQGVSAIREDMKRLDFSGHPTPEMLDDYAQGRISQFSGEYSQLVAHLSECRNCAGEVELLRQSVRMVPEDEPLLVAAKRRGVLDRLVEWFTTPQKALAVAVPVLVVLLALVFLQPWSGNDVVTTVELLAQFERRNISADGAMPEYQVKLDRGTRELIFSFVTDRVDIPEYEYNIELSPRPGTPISLSGSAVNCEQTELTNKCLLSVVDNQVLNLLKNGGSFTILISEQFPQGVDLEPAQYEYYFKVTVTN